MLVFPGVFLLDVVPLEKQVMDKGPIVQTPGDLDTSINPGNDIGSLDREGEARTK